MLHRLFLVVSVLVVGSMVGSCTKCGPIWDDWLPKSCRSDHLDR